MLRAASSQSTLAFFTTGKRQLGHGGSTAYIQTTLLFGKEQQMGSQLERLREVTHRLLGRHYGYSQILN